MSRPYLVSGQAMLYIVLGGGVWTWSLEVLLYSGTGRYTAFKISQSCFPSHPTLTFTYQSLQLRHSLLHCRSKPAFDLTLL